MFDAEAIRFEDGGGWLSLRSVSFLRCFLRPTSLTTIFQIKVADRQQGHRKKPNTTSHHALEGYSSIIWAVLALFSPFFQINFIDTSRLTVTVPDVPMIKS
jgi:hypothetical protein